MKVSLIELSKCKKLFGMEYSREPMFNSNTWTTEYLCLNYIPTILLVCFTRYLLTAMLNYAYKEKSDIFSVTNTTRLVST